MSIYKLVNRKGEPVDQGNRFYKTNSGRYAETQTPLVNSKGEFYLIDINAWPSFALFRDEASTRIADYLYSKVPDQVGL